MIPSSLIPGGVKTGAGATFNLLQLERQKLPALQNIHGLQTSIAPAAAAAAVSTPLVLFGCTRLMTLSWVLNQRHSPGMLAPAGPTRPLSEGLSGLQFREKDPQEGRAAGALRMLISS